MFRFLTSGESHGQALTAIVEGIPAGLKVDLDFINKDLARRQQGYGRGGRMKIEKDQVIVDFDLGDVPVRLLEKDVKDYREKYKRGSHEGTFEYIFEQLLKIKDSTLMTELSTFFSKLKDDRCDADYKMYRQFNKGSFDISQENFKKVVAILEKIEVI